MTGYDYNWEETLQSTQPVTAAALNTIPDTIMRLRDDVQNNYIARLTQHLLQEHGITTLAARLDACVVSVVGTDPDIQFNIYVKYYIKTQQPLHYHNQPYILPALIKLTAIVIGIIVVAYVIQWAIVQIANSLKSLTTLTKTTTLHDDNPESKNYCITQTVTEETSNIANTAMVIVIAIAIAIVAVAFLLRKK
jgi:hypothetical protein